MLRCSTLAVPAERFENEGAAANRRRDGHEGRCARRTWPCRKRDPALCDSQAQPDPDRRAGRASAVHHKHGRVGPIIPAVKDAAGDDDVHGCRGSFVSSNRSPAQTTVDSHSANSAPMRAFLAILLHSPPLAEVLCVSLIDATGRGGAGTFGGACVRPKIPDLPRMCKGGVRGG